MTRPNVGDEKPLFWMGSALKEVTRFPPEVQRSIGFALSAGCPRSGFSDLGITNLYPSALILGLSSGPLLFLLQIRQILGGRNHRHSTTSTFRKMLQIPGHKPGPCRVSKRKKD